MDQWINIFQLKSILLKYYNMLSTFQNYSNNIYMYKLRKYYCVDGRLTPIP